MQEKRLVLIVTINDEKQYLDLDTINDVSVVLRSTVSEYPLVEGDSISDHMYRQPTTINISGTFAMNGRFANTYNGSSNRLTAVQALFEQIKDDKLFVDIASRFTLRQNYVLQDISWNERASSLDYSFSFKQVYLAKITETDYEVDVSDPNLPALQDFVQLDLTETLIDWEEIDVIVLQALRSEGLVSDNFLKEFAGAWSVSAIGSATLAISIAIGTALSVPVVGWVLVGVAAVAAGIWSIFKAVSNESKRKKYKIQAFELYKDDRQKQAEFERFANFMGNIHNELQVLEYSGQVFTLAVNENQECIMQVGGNYYIFTFSKNNTTQTWSLVITDINGETIASIPTMLGIASLADATPQNNAFKTKDGWYCYLINTKLEELNNTQNKNLTNDINKEGNVYSDLRNFTLFVTTVDMSNWNNMLKDIIVNAMKV